MIRIVSYTVPIPIYFAVYIFIYILYIYFAWTRIEWRIIYSQKQTVFNYSDSCVCNAMHCTDPTADLISIFEHSRKIKKKNL